MLKTTIPQGVLQRQHLHRDLAANRRAPRKLHRRCSPKRSERAESRAKNFLGKCPRASTSVDRIRRESRESPASDSPEASSQ
jgi:hypothetical protein